MKKNLYKINLEDISQIVLGAAVMAVPIAFSEELWKFGETLPALNIFILFVLAISIQGFYTYYSIFQCSEKSIQVIGVRVILNYTLTFFTVAVVLFSLNRFDFSSNLSVGVYRVIILTFPASLGAVIIDGFDKEL